MFGPSPAVRSFYLNIFHLHGQGGSGRLWNRNGYHVVVYDRSMKWMGRALLCDVRRMETENVEFFFFFFMEVFLVSVVSIYIRQINIIRIKKQCNAAPKCTDLVDFTPKNTKH